MVAFLQVPWLTVRALLPTHERASLFRGSGARLDPPGTAGLRQQMDPGNEACSRTASQEDSGPIHGFKLTREAVAVPPRDG